MWPFYVRFSVYFFFCKIVEPFNCILSIIWWKMMAFCGKNTHFLFDLIFVFFKIASKFCTTSCSLTQFDSIFIQLGLTSSYFLPKSIGLLHCINPFFPNQKNGRTCLLGSTSFVCLENSAFPTFSECFLRRALYLTNGRFCHHSRPIYH